MTDKTKITLSAKELELVCNKEWILTKQNIVEKVYHLFGSVSQIMQQNILQKKAILPELVVASNPKISKGENYLQLPYVMLDYPRHFTKESTIAIRSLFWWGNFFSIQLLLSGKLKDDAMAAIITNFNLLQQHEYFLCINASPWHHYFETDNYVPLKNYSCEEFTTVVGTMPFIKIAKKIPLEKWNAASEFLVFSFDQLLIILQINCPIGETDL